MFEIQAATPKGNNKPDIWATGRFMQNRRNLRLGIFISVRFLERLFITECFIVPWSRLQRQFDSSTILNRKVRCVTIVWYKEMYVKQTCHSQPIKRTPAAVSGSQRYFVGLCCRLEDFKQGTDHKF